jgi:hypothetical protein
MSDRAITRLWALGITLAVLFFLREGLTPGEQVLGGHDTAGAFVPWWQLWRESLAAGYLPLWDVTTFAGYPFFANPQVGLFYPPAWLALILPVNAAVGWYTALHIALAGVGMLLFVRSRGAVPHAAGIAGLAFAFSGFFIIRAHVGHIGLIAVTAWVPWLLYATVKAMEARTLRAAALGALPWAGVLLGGHITSLSYIGMLWAGFVLLLLIETGDRLHLLRQVAVIGGLGGLLAAVQLVPLMEIVGLSQRAVQMTLGEAAMRSLPPVQLLTLLMPGYFGHWVSVGYWGGFGYEELILYAGVMPALGVVAAVGQPARHTVFWLIMAVFGLWIALGSYAGLFAFLWNTIPGFDLFRVPARGGLLYVVAAPVLLADFLSRERTPAGWAALGVGGALFAAVAIVAVQAGWGEAVLPAQNPGQLAYRAAELPRTLLLVGAGVAALAGFHFVPARYEAIVAVLIAGLLLFDLWGFGAKFVRTVPAAPAAFWQQAASAIAEQPGDPGRVLPWGVQFFEQNDATLTGLQSILGYNPLEVNHAHQLYASGGDPRDQRYDVLGVRYLLTGQPAEEFTTGERAVEAVHQGEAVWVYERATTLPLVRHTPQVIAIPDAEAARQTLLTPGFDPARTAISPTPLDCDNPQPAALSMEAQRPGYWRLTVEAQGGPAYIVLAEADYPGWRAFINGERVEHQRVYTALKGVCVPEGAHLLEWRFRPVSLWVGAALSGGALLALIAAAASPRRAAAPSVFHPPR